MGRWKKVANQWWKRRPRRWGFVFISHHPLPRLLFKNAGDYTLHERKKEPELMYVNKKGDIMTLEMVGPICCRPIKKTCKKGKDCVRKKGNDWLISNHLWYWHQILGKKLCNKQDERRDSKIKTCGDLKEFFKKKLKKKNSPLKVMKKSTTTKNPKCQNIFREGKVGSRIEEDEPLMRPLLCHKEMCRAKDRIPDKRVYKDRTLEFGIVVDKYLFHEMKVELWMKYSQHSPLEIFFSH